LSERVEVDRGRFRLAVVLSFILWGSGGLLLKRGRLDVLAVALHLYLYFLFWLFYVPGVWLLGLPVAAIGGAYFALDLGRSFRAVEGRGPTLPQYG